MKYLTVFLAWLPARKEIAGIQERTVLQGVCMRTHHLIVGSTPVQKEEAFTECYRNLGIGQPSRAAVLGNMLAELIPVHNGHLHLSFQDSRAIRLSL